MWNLWQDLRHSARLLLQHPGFTLTAISVLTLGIGVNAGIFGIINGVLIRPLAGADAPGELVGVYSKDRTTDRGYRPFSYPGFADLREAGGPFAHLAAHNIMLGGVTENGTTRQAMIDVITTDYFKTLGLRPAYGRDLTLEEERPGTAARSVIISYPLWERSGFARDILGQTIRINGQDLTIVGVAPEHFTGTTAIGGTDYYMAVGVYDAIDAGDGRLPFSDRRNKPLLVIGRLQPGVTRDQADARLHVIAAAHEHAYPDDNRNQDLLVRTPSRVDMSATPQDDAVLWLPVAMLHGLAAAVLLTACLNLANMMLAFGASRQKEIAIRLAVGAARSRIVRQLLVQGLLLSLAGGACGLLAATWAAELLMSSMAAVLPITLALDFSPDMRVLVATLAFCTCATLGFGLWPALRLSRPDLVSSLKQQSGELAGRIGRRLTVRGALVTVQLALSLALLVLSGLFVRAATAGASADPGFDLNPLVIAQIEPEFGGYDAVRGREARRAILERLRSMPGVTAAATSSVLPFGDSSDGAVVQRDGPRLKSENPEAAGRLVQVHHYRIASDYFKTLGLPLRRGREFTAAEETGVSATMPVIIDAGLADRLFPNENPVGQLLQFGADSGPVDSPPMLIVGVAPGVKHELFANPPEPHLYTPSSAGETRRMFVFARAAGSQRVDDLVGTVRERLRAADPNLPLIFVKSYRSQHEGSAPVWFMRAAANLFLTLGLAAALVAVIGLYGVRSYLVARRTREFGIRMAIGASPADVLRLVLKEAVATTAAGLAIGAGVGLLLGRGFSAVFHRINPVDPLTMAGAIGLLAVASIVASIVPARRAARVMPMIALRND